MERQLAPTIEGIAADHVARYRFAASIADATVLDAACGCGYGSKILHDSGCDVIGVDIERSAIEYAKQHYAGPTYVNSAIKDYQFPSVDCIVSFETLEHLADPVHTLDYFRSFAQLLIVSVPNESLQPFDSGKFREDKYPHLRHYTPEQLKYTLNQSGWTVLGKWCQKDKKTPEVIPGTDGHILIYVCR